MATSKLWKDEHEWISYASCGGSVDHILSPDDPDGPVCDVDSVASICGRCRVRPECIKAAVKSESVSVWVAGTWIPDDKRKAKRVRGELELSLPDEYLLRGDDV